MPVYERISIVVSLTLIGLALYFVLEFPEQTATFILFNTPVGLTAPRQWLMAVLLTGLAMSGTDAVIRSHPRLPDVRLSYRATFWTLPGLLVMLSTQTLGLASTTIIWVAGVVGVGALLWLTILAQYRQLAPETRLYDWPYWWQQFIGYGLALALFTVIYYPRSRSAVSASAVLLVSGMIALALLRGNPSRIAVTWLFAAIIAVGLAQMTWALNYWRVSTLQAALLLFAVFYALVGIARQRLHGALSKRVLAELGGVTVALLLLGFYV